MSEDSKAPVEDDEDRVDVQRMPSDGADVQPFPVPCQAMVQAATVEGQKAGIFQAATPTGMVVLFFDEDSCRALARMFAEAAGDRGGLVVAGSLPGQNPWPKGQKR